MKQPDFTIGIEEEYLVVDQKTMELAKIPDEMMQACKAELQDQVSPEYLQCQIEIGTKVCANVSQARDDLKRLRSTISKHAATYGLTPMAASCHPFADWKQQHHTDKERYNTLRSDLMGVVRRLLISGMHVHVGIPDKDMRIDLLNQLTYFLPHLLALSASSPYWQGEDTGLDSYRLTVFDNLPRTGLPPKLQGWGEYERSVQALVSLGLIEDSSKIWWDLRPSQKFPTIESRICDLPSRLEHSLCLAAMIQCLCRMLWRLAKKNQRWRLYDNFLLNENRWRAQRYGVGGGLVDFGRHEIIPMTDLIDELVELLARDAEELGCVAELQTARDIVRNGNCADRQRAVYKAACDQGKSSTEALRDVARHLVQEFHADL
ncbi:MAG: carboxylate-amine ligase [Rhodobacterales bacterium]|nr:MAG: carboxylate-amine ligase [Rhodobacterales bacterium]